jgi:hypothetical protein
MATFVRELRTRATTEAIARRTSGMVRVPPDSVELAPRPCGFCRGTGQGPRGTVCAECRGAGASRRFAPGDPSHVVVVRGPCGLGEQRLVAVALADGGIGYVHVRPGGAAPDVYRPAAVRRAVLRWGARSRGVAPAG